MLGILAGMDQKDYCTFYWQWHLQGLVCWPLHLAMCSLRGWQAQMLSFLAGTNQKDYFAFYTVVHTPVVCNDRCFYYGVQKTADFPQLQFIDGRRFSCRGAQVDSHGLAVQQTIETPQLLLYMWSMPLVCWSSWFPRRCAQAVSHGPNLFV